MAMPVHHTDIFETTGAWQSSVLSDCRFLLPYISRGALRGEHAGYSSTILRCLSWSSSNCIQSPGKEMPIRVLLTHLPGL
jgi:hypothetical protein